MIIDEIIARLAAAADTPFAMIEGAAALSAITDAPEAMPAAYVFAKERAAEPNEHANIVQQRVVLDVAVVLITDNVADANGAAAAGDIEALHAHVVATLLGWQPPSATDPIELVGGEVVNLRAGTVWWETIVTTAYYVRSL